jgi:hypothetical protein
MADVNADGRADYCRFVGNDPDTFLSCALAKADNTFGNWDVNGFPGNFDPGYPERPASGRLHVGASAFRSGR